MKLLRTKVADDRERGGYNYYDDSLDLLHASSAPRTDKEAVELIATVNKWFPSFPVKFVSARNMNEYEQTFIAEVKETGEVVMIGAAPADA